jgi:hypothetical protein
LNRPANKEELFNLRHSQARNVIERIFGVLKRRFRILLLAPEFSIKIQAKIPAALCAIHNFIHHHDPQEGEISENIDSERSNHTSHAGDETVGPGMESEIDDSNVHARRERIATAMWENYQQVLQDRDAEGINDFVRNDDESDEEDMTVAE